MYVIIGGTGFLGSNIVRSLRERTREAILVVARNPADCSLPDVPGGVIPDFVRCDVSKRDNLDELIARINLIEEPCRIIYLAASLHPEEVERDQWASWNINVISLEYLLSGIKHPEMFLFTSTDSVYGSGGREHLFCEEERLNPVNLYGTQKVAGEAIVTHYGGNVFRYPLLLGPSIIKGRRHFYDDLVESLRNGRPVELFEDSYRSTLDFRTAAELTIALVMGYGGSLPPVLNIAGDEALSKYDVGIRIAARLGISGSSLKVGDRH